MRLAGIIMLLSLMAGTARADIKKFPYEAEVKTDEVAVRCGPGMNYYATSKVKKGERVIVRRHNPGGWYMIDPPGGSFSWIDVKNVKRLSDKTGRVEVPPGEKASRAIVRIGSEYGDDHSFYSRELSQGEEVEIVGEKTLQTERGVKQMYKIRPPRQEFRWVPGQFIVPVDPALRRERDQNAFEVPSDLLTGDLKGQGEEKENETSGANSNSGSTQGVEDGVRDRAGLRTRELIRDWKDAVRGENGGVDDLTARAELRKVDEQLQKMLRGRAPAEWDFSEIRKSYERIKGESKDADFQALIDGRLKLVESRQQIKNELDRFQPLPTELTGQETKLLSTQGKEVETKPATTGASNLEDLNLDESQLKLPGGVLLPEAGEGKSNAAPPRAPTGMTSALPRLDGAGVLQKTSGGRGMPTYLLMAPDGRLLAYVTAAQGVNLEQYVGRDVGLIGQRTFQPRMQADVIVVRRVVSVRLKR